MLDVKSPEHLKKVKEFAASKGLLEQLESKLQFLDEYAEGNTRCELYPDFAPYSFYFQIYLKAEASAAGKEVPYLNGGLIYYGKGESGVGTPQFSVKTGELKEGWSIHT